jgi:2-methylcitrate dehydratase PrpD
MELTRYLADHVASIDVATMSTDVRVRAIHCLLDLISAAAAGYHAPAADMSRSEARFFLGDGGTPIWMANQNASLAGAIFCNAASASALDLDDGHRAARGHPGACVIPVVLSVAATEPSVTAADALAAIIVGYEVGVRIAAAQNPEGIPTHQSGRWSALAAAAAAGRLLRATPSVIAQALAISGVLSPNMRANGSSGYSKRTGNHVKEGIPFSAVTGAHSFVLARRGYTGPTDLLDHPDFYDEALIRQGLGQDFQIMGTYFKRYACCRYIHPAIDAFRELIAIYQLAAEEISKIEVYTFSWAKRLENSLGPRNIVELQYSLPYCLAAVALVDADSLLPIGDHLLGRADLSAFSRKVSIMVDPVCEDAFPAQTMANVVVHARDTRFVSGRREPIGDVARPMTWEDLVSKFRRLATPSFGTADQDDIIDSLEAMLEDGGTSDVQVGAEGGFGHARLLNVLARPCGPAT